MHRFVLGAVAMVLSLLARPADAHLGNLSHAELEARGSQVVMRFRYAAHLTPGLPVRDKPYTRAEILAREGGIRHWLADAATVTSPAGPCRFELDNIVGPDPNDDLEVTAGWTCDEADVRGVRIEFHPLAGLVDGWQTIASLRMGGQSYSTVFSQDSIRWHVGEPVTAPRQAAGDEELEHGGAPDDGGSAFARFFRLGIHHIWTGYDHLLFLLAVLLAGGGFGRIVAIVTSFTVAHSITLGAAATGLVQLPVEPVEAVIALSIVYVAVENMLGRGGDRRALVTFFFGLIHGFGFASVLSETALPPGDVVVPLLAFNLGVEAGQLAVVVVVVPLLAVALRSSAGRAVKLGLSALIAIAGAMWAVERIGTIVQGG
jgi:hypothetical protein